LIAGLNPVIKTVIAGVVDLIQGDVLRVEYNAAHFADVRGVNRAIGKITNYRLNGQGKTKKHSGKASKHRETESCFRCGAIGHWKRECKVGMEPAVFWENATRQTFAFFFSKSKQQILWKVAGQELSPSCV
jgi:hypothetical protein